MVSARYYSERVTYTKHGFVNKSQMKKQSCLTTFLLSWSSHCNSKLGPALNLPQPLPTKPANDQQKNNHTYKHTYNTPHYFEVTDSRAQNQGFFLASGKSIYLFKIMVDIDLILSETPD